MPDLRTLVAEVAAIVARFDRIDDGDELNRLEHRIEELVATINAALPQSLGDCLCKLQLLADADVGIAVGERADDLVSLRQVAQFLEGFGQ